MTVTIRALAAREGGERAAELAALGTRSKGAWGYDDAFMARFAGQMDDWIPEFIGGMRDDDGRVLLVAEDGDLLVGYALVEQTDPARPALLEDLWVEPERMRGGIGSLLLAAALDAARRAGRDALEFESDPHAEGFYLRKGARRIGEQVSEYHAGGVLPVLRFDL